METAASFLGGQAGGPPPPTWAYIAGFSERRPLVKEVKPPKSQFGVIVSTTVTTRMLRRDSRPRAHPAGQHGPCAEVRKAAGLAFSRLHFGGFAPRAWRVSACRLEKKSGFSGIAPANLVLF